MFSIIVYNPGQKLIKFSKAAKAKFKENEGIMTFEAFLKSMYKAEQDDTSVTGEEEEEEEEEDEYAFLYDDTDNDESPMEMEFSPIRRGKLSFNNSMESDTLFENGDPSPVICENKKKKKRKEKEKEDKRKKKKKVEKKKKKKNKEKRDTGGARKRSAPPGFRPYEKKGSNYRVQCKYCKVVMDKRVTSRHTHSSSSSSSE